MEGQHCILGRACSQLNCNEGGQWHELGWVWLRYEWVTWKGDVWCIVLCCVWIMEWFVHTSLKHPPV